MNPATTRPLAVVTAALIGATACGHGAAPSSSETSAAPTTEIAKPMPRGDAMPTTTQTPPEPAKLANPTTGAAGDAATSDTPASAAWRIEAGRVGSIEIRKRLPDALLDDQLAARYLARYIADGQPVDAFAWDAPPVLVILASGPFRAQVEKTGKLVEPPSNALRSKAAIAARRGAKVQGVMVRGAGPTTAAGVGVGSTLAALKAAYADLQLTPVPETLGNDVCRASTSSLPGVQFMFASCSDAKGGAPVMRVDVWNPTE